MSLKPTHERQFSFLHLLSQGAVVKTHPHDIGIALRFFSQVRRRKLDVRVKVRNYSNCAVVHNFVSLMWATCLMITSHKPTHPMLRLTSSWKYSFSLSACPIGQGYCSTTIKPMTDTHFHLLDRSWVPRFVVGDRLHAPKCVFLACNALQL